MQTNLVLLTQRKKLLTDYAFFHNRKLKCIDKKLIFSLKGTDFFLNVEDQQESIWMSLLVDRRTETESVLFHAESAMFTDWAKVQKGSELLWLKIKNTPNNDHVWYKVVRSSKLF